MLGWHANPSESILMLGFIPAYIALRRRASGQSRIANH